MKKILIMFLLLIITIPAYSKHTYKEKVYQDIWCNNNNGTSEVVLFDGARVDCVTKEYAIEFDFAQKWAESIGQSLYYAGILNKKPAVVLILEDGIDNSRYIERLNCVAKKYGIKVFYMSSKDVRK